MSLSLEEAVQAAVKYCIKHDILKVFLKKHGTEVINILFLVFAKKSKKGVKMKNEDAVKKAIDYCIENNILKDFLENNTADVMKMLVDELYMRDVLAIRDKDEESRKEIARNILTKDANIEFVQTITDLGLDVIQDIQRSIQY